jgi:hypothetical protein
MMTDTKVTLTAEMLDRLEEDECVGPGNVYVSVERCDLRALIDAAREWATYRANYERVLPDVDAAALLDAMATGKLDEHFRAESFALVERELREASIDDVELWSGDEHGVRTNVVGGHGPTLLEAVDAARKVRL